MLAAARHDSGLDLDRLALVRIDFNLQKIDEASARRTLARVLAEARLQPRAEAAALVSGLPVGTGTPGVIVAETAGSVRDGMLGGDVLELVAGTPDLFRTLGIEIRAGRSFDDRDSSSADPVCVLNESMVRQLFGTAAAVGRQVVVQRRRWFGERTPAIRTVTIVGIAEDTDTGTVGRRARGVVYVPFAQHYEPGMAVAARYGSGSRPSSGALERIVARVDPDLAILDAGSGVTLGGADNLVLKVGSAAAGGLGGLALVLAMAGLYGLLSDLVVRRTREIGIRMALGADASRVVRMVIADGLRPVLGGLAIGIVFGVLLRMGFRPLFLRMVPEFDPILLAIVPLAFCSAALLAAYLPARRASRVDPNVALRHL
jgi:hypothetical protein